MSFRYQVVITREPEGHPLANAPVYSFCEVYLSKAGVLESWTDPSCVPTGVSMDDLRGTLSYMLAEAFRWEPVEYADLKEGMTFKRAETILAD